MTKFSATITVLVTLLSFAFQSCSKKDEPATKTDAVITWANPADITQGTALGATQLNATANVAGTFVYTPAIGVVLNAGNAQNLKVDFTPTDATKYNAASKTVLINVTASSSALFSWKEDGGATIEADSAFWTTWATGTGIRAYKGGFQNFFEVNWATQNNTSVGTKALTMGVGDFTFMKGSSTYDISSNQNLSITAFTNNKISGNFTFSVSGGTIASIQATFNNLPKK